MNQERLFKVLLGAHITEKAASASGVATQVAVRGASDASKLCINRNLARSSN